MSSWWENRRQRWEQQWWSDDQKWPAQQQWKQQATWNDTHRCGDSSPSTTTTTATDQKLTEEQTRTKIQRRRASLEMEWDKNRLHGLVVTNFKTLSAGHNGIVLCDWFLQTLIRYLFRVVSSEQQVPAPFSLSVWRFSGPLARHPDAGRICLGLKAEGEMRRSSQLGREQEATFFSTFISELLHAGNSNCSIDQFYSCDT